MAADVKLCLICKKYFSNKFFRDHFLECRKKLVTKQRRKINPKKITRSNGGCGCRKKKLNK